VFLIGGGRVLNRAFVSYYRCPEEYALIAVHGTLSKESGFFQFGPGQICYNQCAAGYVTPRATEELYDAWQDTQATPDGVYLPFDPATTIDNLRLEKYPSSSSKLDQWLTNFVLRDAYYLLRPMMPSSLRGWIQRLYFKGWEDVLFPRWPLDLTVDKILQNLMSLLLKHAAEEGIPFIWFWPDGFSACALMTHDVDSEDGLGFCSALMDIDESWGIKSSFQLVPEGRYHVSDTLLSEIARRGCEVNVHDLNHDGRLFRNRRTFFSRVKKINEYIKEYGAAGFRAGAMYRVPEWFEALDVSYDMSIPNAAHMEPQQGGCCTVMPFFIGNILELPLTMTQDWALFNVLREHSTDLWNREMDVVVSANGMASFITHPDYLISPKTLAVYSALLGELSKLRSARKLWISLPREINRWWRERAQMKLEFDRGQWKITGPGSERAHIAYARLLDGRLCYVVGPSIYPQGRSVNAQQRGCNDAPLPVAVPATTSGVGFAQCL
jgi:hypothetical protein